MTIATPQQSSAPEASDRLQIDTWSDLACPWCYIGKHRLDQAIASLPYAEAITVTVRSYELDPSMSRTAMPNLELLAARYGVTPARAEHMEDRLVGLAHSEGLPYVADRVIANSFDVHRVLHLADTYGLAYRLLGVLQHALFSGEVDVYDPEVLAGAASSVGVARDRVLEVLSGDEYADAVRADEEEARKLGVTGIPFTVFDGRIALPGVTTVQGFATAIDQAWEAR